MMSASGWRTFRGRCTSPVAAPETTCARTRVSWWTLVPVGLPSESISSTHTGNPPDVRRDSRSVIVGILILLSFLTSRASREWCFYPTTHGLWPPLVPSGRTIFNHKIMNEASFWYALSNSTFRSSFLNIQYYLFHFLYPLFPIPYFYPTMT